MATDIDSVSRVGRQGADEIRFEELHSLEGFPNQQHVMDYCHLRVRSRLAIIYGWERAMRESVSMEFCTINGAKFARASWTGSSKEVRDLGISVKSHQFPSPL